MRIGAEDSRLILSPGMVLYSGRGIAAGMHRHHAVQAVQSFDGDFELRFGSKRVCRASSSIVPANASHALESNAKRIVLVLVERQGPRGGAIDAMARELEGQDLSRRIGTTDRLPSTPDEAVSWAESWLARLGCTTEPSERFSSSVERALHYIEGSVDAGPRLDEAARFGCISPSRLTHVFTREVGIPFRRYVLWFRMKLAIEHVRHGANLTEAAVGAGFSDSAHLSRTFREMFGLSPSMALMPVEFAGCLWSEKHLTDPL